MKFDSPIFFAFLSIFILIYFKSIKSKNFQNFFLLTASIFFYATWDIIFVFILLFNIIVGFLFGKFSNNKKDSFFTIGIIILLFPLFFYKYFYFILTNLASLLSFNLENQSYNLLLPLGISFYTFHGISYLIDLKNQKYPVENSFIDYSVFISYFPLLLAGPIERSNTLLPQLKTFRVFNYNNAVSGTRLILFGLWKKVFISNSLALFNDKIFNNYNNESSLFLLMGVIGFMFQVYSDFSGYTDIARGTSRILGIELIKNFNFPFFSKSIPEYWSRWHISLSSWLNDYIFNPIAIRLRNYGRFGIIISIFVTFLVSGIWHGASWNFVFWGLLFAFSYLPYTIFQSKLSFTKIKSSNNYTINLLNIFYFQSILFITFLFFRFPNIKDGFNYLDKLFNFNNISYSHNFSYFQLTLFFIQIISMLLVDYSIFSRNILFKLFFSNIYFRYALYTIFSLLILIFINRNGAQFIYFQF
jgi:D-alanyl-lipoteichoic acid acyltransferase DltB (MBOAT superfamily)